MNIYTGLLFQHGYIQNPELAVSLAGDGDDAQAASDAPASPRDVRQPRRRGGAFRLGALVAMLNALMSPPR
ncbi:hypothetical protein AB4Y64_13445 [Lysobacter sp. TAF61]|uniref:hypothetical protein n=1 Tax=Lysobacter sp. TAF61 TaxID=3233072 RepID=UPI003F952AA4